MQYVYVVYFMDVENECRFFVIDVVKPRVLLWLVCSLTVNVIYSETCEQRSSPKQTPSTKVGNTIVILNVEYVTE